MAAASSSIHATQLNWPPAMLAVARFARRNPTAAFGAVILVTWAVIALTIPLWSASDPLAQNMDDRLVGPSSRHLFGTDLLGRDVLARVLWGARLSLPTALAVIAAALIFGGAFGMAAGYVGGRLDEAMMRLADITLAFPSIILAMAIAAALGPSLRNAMVAMTAVWWPEFARVMRGQVLAVKEYPHVEAARVLGASHWRIITRHILPETFSPLMVKATLDFGNVILLAAGLSFLGLGAVPPAPEWGAMVSEARTTFTQWWIGTFPGLAIVMVVLSANFLGDGLRDYFDPRIRKQ
jgi:peptide/nickel transport system permease protein